MLYICKWKLQIVAKAFLLKLKKRQTEWNFVKILLVSHGLNLYFVKINMLLKKQFQSIVPYIIP